MRRLLAVVLLVCAAGAQQVAPTLDQGPRFSSFMFRDAPVEYAMSILGDTWRRHIVVTDSAKNVKVRTFLKDIDCLSALKAICHSHGLWYREDPQSGVIYLQRIDEFIQGNSLQEKKFLEVITVVYPRAEDLAASLQEVFRDMVVYTQPEDDSGDDYDDVDRALDRMDQLSERSTILEGDASSSSSTRSSTSSRSSSSTSRRRNTRQGVREGMDNVTEYYDDMTRLNKRRGLVVETDDGKPKAQTPGVVFVSVVRRSNALVLRSSDREILEQVKEMVTKLDKPKPQVLLEMRVLALDVTDEKDREIDFITQNSTHELGELAVGYATGLSEAQGAYQMGQLALSQAQNFGNSSVFQVLNKHYGLRLKLLDEKGKVRSLATPSLLVADFEASRVFVGQEATILMDVESSQNVTSGDNPVVTVTENADTERRDIGTTLVVTPKIHADGTVTIRVMQESATLGATRTISYGSESGKSFDTTDIKKQTITSTVVAKSGETIALGGLMQHEVEEHESKIPFLGDIPYLGMLFRHTQKINTESELMVLIRPTVVLAPSELPAATKDLVKATVTDAASVQEGMDKTRKARIKKANENMKRDLEAEAKAEEERLDNKSWVDWNWFGEKK